MDNQTEFKIHNLNPESIGYCANFENELDL